MTTSNSVIPALPEASPAQTTLAACPPIVALTGKTSDAGWVSGILPSTPEGFVDPPPVPNTVTVELWAAGVEAVLSVSGSFMVIAGPVPPFQVKTPGAAGAMGTLADP